MQPINPTSRNQIGKILDSIHDDIERLVDLKMNVDEFDLMDSYKLNILNILDSINSMRFQISEEHYQEQLDKESSKFQGVLVTNRDECGNVKGGDLCA